MFELNTVRLCRSRSK